MGRRGGIKQGIKRLGAERVSLGCGLRRLSEQCIQGLRSEWVFRLRQQQRLTGGDEGVSARLGHWGGRCVSEQGIQGIRSKRVRSSDGDHVVAQDWLQRRCVGVGLRVCLRVYLRVSMCWGGRMSRSTSSLWRRDHPVGRMHRGLTVTRSVVCVPMLRGRLCVARGWNDRGRDPHAATGTVGLSFVVLSSVLGGRGGFWVMMTLVVIAMVVLMVALLVRLLSRLVMAVVVMVHRLGRGVAG